MSTHTQPDTRQASPATTSVDHDTGSDPSGERDRQVDPWETHNSAARFSTDCTRRLPNTVDAANEHAGSVPDG